VHTQRRVRKERPGAAQTLAAAKQRAAIYQAENYLQWLDQSTADNDDKQAGLWRTTVTVK